MTPIDDALLDALGAEAAASPRRRRNRNFHPDDDFPAHRLLNAMQADSYIPPHRHLDPNKDETFVVLRGALGVLVFDDAGQVVETLKVSAGGVKSPEGGTARGVDIPHGTWHTAVCLADGTVFLEAKAGPYRPFAPEERAPWAPAENSPDAPAYLESLRRHFA